MERMKTTLEERLTAALAPHVERLALEEWFTTPGADITAQIAEEALAALGLNDLDAAVERAAKALAVYGGNAQPHFYVPRASVALRAALSATEEGEYG